MVRCSLLSSEYMDLYQRCNRLRQAIRHDEKILLASAKRLTELQGTFDKLGLRNDAKEVKKRLLKLMDEVEAKIPDNELWLPPSE
jgi:hypothetical protein